MGWWGDNVPEETLSRDEASRVIRRLMRMLKPQRMRVALAAIVLMFQAAALLAGPWLVKVGIDKGLPSSTSSGNATALNVVVVVYLCVAIAAVFLGRAHHPRGPHQRELLHDLPNRLFGHVMSLSLDTSRVRRRADVAHDVRHRRDAGAHLPRPRAVRAERLPLHRRHHLHVGAVVAARPRRARDRAPRLLRESVVPPRLQQGLPRGARPHLGQPEHPAGEPRGRARRAGVRARARVHDALPEDERRPVRREHVHDARLGQVFPGHRWASPASP